MKMYKCNKKKQKAKPELYMLSELTKKRFSVHGVFALGLNCIKGRKEYVIVYPKKCYLLREIKKFCTLQKWNFRPCFCIAASQPAIGGSSFVPPPPPHMHHIRTPRCAKAKVCVPYRAASSFRLHHRSLMPKPTNQDNNITCSVIIDKRFKPIPPCTSLFSYCNCK